MKRSGNRAFLTLLGLFGFEQSPLHSVFALHDLSESKRDMLQMVRLGSLRFNISFELFPEKLENSLDGSSKYS